MILLSASNPLSVCEYAVNYLVSPQETLLVYSSSAGILVFTGIFNTLDAEYCDRYRIRVLQLPYHGGSIVSFPGDLELAFLHWGPSYFAKECVSHIEDWLKDKGHSITRQGNDLLINDKKIASYTVTAFFSGWYLDALHFSVSINEHLIRKICTKHMKKNPGELKDYGVSAKDILNVLCEKRMLKEDQIQL